ncbi:hypothetical protein [Streptomyces sp. NPDC018045]|uniref:hypothetical protein n=1 Tax=Streptomyces sp. NPDC018045 TaxID=3365037 RepID=UPI0037A9CC6A
MLDRIHVRFARLPLALAATAVLLSTVCSCGGGPANRAKPSSASPVAASAAPATAPSPSGETATARREGKAPPVPRPSAPRRGDSPGRHDGSAYERLSTEGRKAHDTENCAKIPGKKKGSCNELHRKCRARGATAVSSKGEHLTCRTSPRDGRLRWLTAGE